MENEPIPDRVNEVAKQVVDAVYKVHVTFGPGLLESTYEACLCRELFLRDIPFERQVELPVVYEGMRLDSGYRLDVIVANLVIVELKAVELLNKVHEAQLLTYLKLSGKRLGFLVNFNVLRIKDGIKRMAN
jgi:GxxExxY protein